MASVKIACPYCDSPEVEALCSESTTMGRARDIDPNRYTEHCRCQKCGRKFRLVFKFEEG